MNNSQEMIDDLTELETLVPQPRVLKLRNLKGEIEAVSVAPLRIDQMAKMAKALRTIVDAGSGKELSVLELMSHYPDEMITIVSAAVDKPNEWFGGLRADIGLKVAIATFEVNSDFFMRSLVPIVAGIAAKITQAADGLKDFKGSVTAGTIAPNAIQ